MVSQEERSEPLSAGEGERENGGGQGRHFVRRGEERGRSETFWTTTGMFPQEFIISLNKCVTLSKLTIQCYLVQTLRIEKTMSKEPVDFELCTEKELQYKEGELQTEEISVSI
ncbi:hypothetical protein JD844_017952 [Phrynosoma platyrhinos]|uniref:Uncharacterized protein n=1 Tax=Phrynosoma platyrhinos TaxID=52577 RepID=A0ABQ7SMU2_PHRPL|nr:hypothetical protein JD844_017952 [Phrynosoma platyrhinos]